MLLLFLNANLMPVSGTWIRGYHWIYSSVPLPNVAILDKQPFSDFHHYLHLLLNYWEEVAKLLCQAGSDQALMITIVVAT